MSQLKRRKLRENKQESHLNSCKEGEKIMDKANEWADDRTDSSSTPKAFNAFHSKIYLSNFAFTLQIFCFY